MTAPWKETMPDDLFNLMRDILAAPSPVGLEGAMTLGVLKPHLEALMPDSWAFHHYRGNAGIVLDTHPGRDDLLSVMICGHADKIRMQVRSIGEDGKIWINSDSFLPTTLLGHEVLIFPRDPQDPAAYKRIQGGTVEALGAIHFANEKLRSGAQGITADMLYVELQIHGDEPRKQIEALGIRPGDPIILNRPIKRGFSQDTFYGAYLDNGLGCFVAAEIARLVAQREQPLNVRLLFAFASHEEIGRMGSRIMAAHLKPDVLIAVDVDHDYKHAPGVQDRRFQPLTMSKGFTLSTGAIVSESLNTLILQAAQEHDIPLQYDVCGRDTGTDGMASVLAAVDSAATSIGFPIRNMHTISETGHTGDVLAAIYAVYHTAELMDRQGVTAEWFRQSHPRLDNA